MNETTCEAIVDIKYTLINNLYKSEQATDSVENLIDIFENVSVKRWMNDTESCVKPKKKRRYNSRTDEIRIIYPSGMIIEDISDK